MKVVIGGAGDIGFHLAELLSYQQKDIVIIDNDAEVLDYAGTHLDIITIQGDAASVETLREAEIASADLFIATTTSEKTNLIASILAKELGAKKTIARISNPEYQDPGTIQTFKKIGIDVVISPIDLAAKEISRLIKRIGVTDFFEFEGGKFNLFGITLDEKTPIANLSVVEVARKYPESNFRPIVILRGDETIIPSNTTVLRRNDHIYLMAQKKDLEDLLMITGKATKKVSYVMILGNTPLSIKTAKVLEDQYSVKIVAKSKEFCKLCVEELDKALVIVGDPSNIELLREEGLEQMDVLISATPNVETNIITSLMAKNLGLAKTIAIVDNKEYTHISQNIGVDTLINKKLITANNIFRYVRKGKVEAITSLHGVDAEIIEFEVTKNNRLTSQPIKDLRMPKDSLIAGVIRDQESCIPKGDFQLKLYDKVIVMTLASSIELVEELFR